MTQPRATGRCHCGAVRFEVRGKLRDVLICHCSDCRRHHGHASAHTRCDMADFVLTEQRGLAWYDTSATGSRGFCRDCGSVLFFQRKGAGRMAINAGVLDTPTGLRSAMHLYVPDKSDYYEIGEDGLPHRDGMPTPADEGTFRYS
ncbi:MAG: GFA family protein [Acetobacteraceae bacterium]